MDESITHEQATSEDAPVSPEADQGSARGDSNGGPATEQSVLEAPSTSWTLSWASTSSIAVSSTTWKSPRAERSNRVHATTMGCPTDR